MKKIIISLLIFFIAFELLLRFSGIYNSYAERSFGEYYFQYRQFKPTWYYTYPANTSRINTNIEFEYYNTHNDLGHRELNFSVFLSDTLTEKIVCIGDSFTEGDGAPADSTWVKRLEVLLNQEKNKKGYRFYNAGINGSDVCYNNKILVEKLVVLKPKIVIECLNNSDIYDIINRGGKERFNKDGTTTGKVGPRWEPIYKYSHVFRAFIRTICGYDNNLIKIKEAQKLKLESLKLIGEQVKETSNFCKKNQIRYILILHPTPNELNLKDFNNNVLLSLNEQPNVINLFRPMINFYEKNELSDYSWKINGHFNSKGYFVMGDLIFQELSKNDSIFKQ